MFSISSNTHSQVMFESFGLMRVLINRLAILWFQCFNENLSYELKQDMVDSTTAGADKTRNLGGRCLKRCRQRIEGGSNIGLILFQRRVLLENVKPETVLPSLIVFLCCTIEIGVSYA